MEWISGRSIYIGVGIFVVLAIATGVILSFNKVGEIYGRVATTQISIKDKFNNVYSMYSDASLNGVELLNTIKRYEDDKTIVVNYIGRETILAVVDENSTNDNNTETKLLPISNSKREVTILKEFMETKHLGFAYENMYSVKVEKDANKIIINFK